MHLMDLNVWHMTKKIKGTAGILALTACLLTIENINLEYIAFLLPSSFSKCYLRSLKEFFDYIYLPRSLRIVQVTSCDGYLRDNVDIVPLSSA